MGRCVIYAAILLACIGRPSRADDLPMRVNVEGQPLAANVGRIVQSLEMLGHPLDESLITELAQARDSRDAEAIQELLDPQVLFVVSINPERRVKVQQGSGSTTLQVSGHTPVLVKIINDATATDPLGIVSPQAGAVYAGESEFILNRQQQTDLASGESEAAKTDRFLDVDVFGKPPMKPTLSGLEVEYVIALIGASEDGKREATIGFDIGQGTQDIGFRGETAVLFDIHPAIPVKLSILDDDGRPTIARLTITDDRGRIHPPQSKRLAPDFFFQPHVYRQHGETVSLPPGRMHIVASRGPEYHNVRKTIDVPASGSPELSIQLSRWIDPTSDGFYCGDHHIHGAGCSHYSSPTKGVTPQDMFRQVKGEGLHVGCVLTWGPCFDFQRNYFSPLADAVSEPMTRLKYDLEISGFGSASMGHVCLLNLKDQTYPGSEGTSSQGWPTWTVPVLRWTKQQGGVTGFPHSAMYINAEGSAQQIILEQDANEDRRLTKVETADALLPAEFAQIDIDRDEHLNEAELTAALERAAGELPNLVVPGMNGGGAMEIAVAVSEGVCDFISAMDTGRVPEWNTWYHLMNCGFPLKVSGETDFPCMSSRRVGQGRVYVRLGEVDQVDFGTWCEGIAAGRSYVTDGFSHALDFTVNKQRPGEEDVLLAQPGKVQVQAIVAFAPEIPADVATGQVTPPEGPIELGDTRILHGPRRDKMVRGGTRKVELVMNGRPVASRDVPADGKRHTLSFEVKVADSSWLAVRQFPQMHTNPVNVLIDDRPIRASTESARWCAATVRTLWGRATRMIAEHERDAAKEAYDRAVERYTRIAEEAAQRGH